MKRLKVLDNEKGYIKLIFVTVVIVFLAYLGIKFGMPYYRYSAFKSDIKEFARVSVGDLNRTKADIIERARDLKIPIEEKDLIIDKKDNMVRVKTSWSETVDVMGLYQKTLDFDIDVEE
jgi:adenine-specific DNA methylase